MEVMTSGQIADALDRARAPELDAIRSALEDHQIVGLTGAAEAGKSRLLALARAQEETDTATAVVQIDLDGVYSPRHLARRWLRAIARGIAGSVAFSHITSTQREVWPSATRRADHFVRSILRDDYETALGVRSDRQRSKGGDEDIARALAAIDRLVGVKPSIVVVDHLESPELSGALDVRRLLWQLRSTSQRSTGLRIVLACRPRAVDLAADENAAFYADGTWLTIEAPTLEAWRRVTGGGRALEEVYELTHGHFWATLLTLERLCREPTQSPLAVFVDVAREHLSLASRCLEHAGTLHRLGPEILRGVAKGIGPYQSVSDALSRDVAAAAQRLELGGLVHHPQRGVWRVINPLVGEALRGARLERTDQFGSAVGE
jgi:hypothetical protein